jgi:hypothetical protein
MGKNEIFYPSAIEALAEQVELRGRRILECACGDDRMAYALKAAGASVTSLDIAGNDGLIRYFTSSDACFERFDGIITNPPYGPRGKTAEAFVQSGILCLLDHAFLAFLLPADFDSAVMRRSFFDRCPAFTAKIVLTQRVERFQDPADPKVSAAWFLWARPLLRRVRPPPIVIYARPAPLLSTTAKSDQAARPHNCAPKHADTEHGLGPDAA